MRQYEIPIQLFVLTQCFSLLIFAHTDNPKRPANDKESGLVLIGKVLGIKQDHSDKYYHQYVVDLEIEFKNTSKQPLILYLDSLQGTSGEWLAFTKEDAEKGNYHLVSQHAASCDISTKWSKLRHSLNTDSPPSDEVFIVKPGDSIRHKIQSRLLIPRKSFFDGTEDILGMEVYKNYSTLWLRIVIDMWPWNLEKYSAREKKFGKKLQKRWISHGYLCLDSIFSQPIELRLNDSQE